MVGHEFCGEIVSVGSKWQDRFQAGDRFSIQPALNYKGSLDAPGYSYRFVGGDATHVVIPNEVMEMDCLLPYTGSAFFLGSLSEPVSCIVGAFRANYHHVAPGRYDHVMDIKEGGNMAILAGVGPMGLGAIDYAIHRDRRPKRLVVTDIDDARLNRAQGIYTPEEAAKNGVELIYVNTKTLASELSDGRSVEDYLIEIADGQGFDDVFAFAPVRPVVEQAGRILGRDGCLNFFAGPTDKSFSAELNFYNVHYERHHIVGTSGGNTDDMREALDLMSRGVVNPAAMITHVGGLNAVADTTLHLPNIPGGKKLMYTNIDLELTAIDDFAEKGKDNPLFAKLAEIVEKHKGLWNGEAEAYLLENAPTI
jgi:threonine dehydrogenase-like Zn-dependent dehydrogenase